MPTVLRMDGLRVVIYPTDHRPAHVHVIGPDWEAAFILHCPEGPPDLRESFGFKTGDLSGIVNALADEMAGLCQKWSEIHGAH
jgi:hypothetical protein